MAAIQVVLIDDRLEIHRSCNQNVAELRARDTGDYRVIIPADTLEIRSYETRVQYIPTLK
jgi:hypothetical protein